MVFVPLEGVCEFALCLTLGSPAITAFGLREYNLPVPRPAPLAWARLSPSIFCSEDAGGNSREVPIRSSSTLPNRGFVGLLLVFFFHANYLIRYGAGTPFDAVIDAELARRAERLVVVSGHAEGRP